ncbi:MAG: Maf-like protein [Alphaproteobacteria bacterium]|jgi:septum formation protein|nr:Maf-like protein [Alphaproteobacteria bacterium]
MAPPPQLILASASPTRRALLAGAGLSFAVEPADIDEGAVTGAPGAVARRLAKQKALAVSAIHPEALVVGGDQVLALMKKSHGVLEEKSCPPIFASFSEKGRIIRKARTRGQAITKIRTLSAYSTHSLHCAVAVAHGGHVLWTHLDRADMTMRTLSTAEIKRYVAAAGPEVTGSVGAYALEGLGAWLFDRVQGDYFTVLGLPLLPLLRYLREQHGMGPC